MVKFNFGLLAFICLFGIHANAQHTDLVDDSQTQVMADTSKKYIIPELNAKKMKWTRFETEFFTTKLGFSSILDYNYNMQNEYSKKQVGEQESRFDIRSARLMFSGKLKFKNPWSYLVSIEYKGLDRREDDPAFGFTDWKLVIPFSKNSDITIGKIKETFVYEMVGDAANLPHFERLLNPFFASRNYGFTYHHFFFKNRITTSGGIYKDWLSTGESFSNSNTTYTARITGLPIWNNDGKQFIHTGVSVRYVDAQNGIVRLKNKNESNITSNYVDTGDMAATHQINFGFEQLWSLQNFSLLMEYVHNWTNTLAFGQQQFNGYYLTGSYVISGEQRPYDQRASYARRIKPKGKFGAWEFITRFGKNDLESNEIHGGINYRYDIGLNWWATQYWKLGTIYGIGKLEKEGITGTTNSIQCRLQWIY